MSEQVEMDEDDRGTTVANVNAPGGEKKRFEVKKVTYFVISYLNVYLIV